MEIHRSYRFEPDVWIKGIYRGNEIIGRTFTQNNKNLVVIIDSIALSRIVKFELIQNIKKFNFNFKRPQIICSLENKIRLTIFEKHILRTLNSINK